MQLKCSALHFKLIHPAISTMQCKMHNAHTMSTHLYPARCKCTHPTSLLSQCTLCCFIVHCIIALCKCTAVMIALQAVQQCIIALLHRNDPSPLDVCISLHTKQLHCSSTIALPTGHIYYCTVYNCILV